MNFELTNPVQTASLYHEFGGLAELRLQARQSPDGATREVAEQFEAIFIQMMLKEMRNSMPEGGLFSGNEMKNYQQMFDQQIAVQLADQHDLGIADMVERALLSRQNKGSDTGTPGTGTVNPISQPGSPNLPEEPLKSEKIQHLLKKFLSAPT